jgi:hypothetical protein
MPEWGLKGDKKQVRALRGERRVTGVGDDQRRRQKTYLIHNVLAGTQCT